MAIECSLVMIFIGLGMPWNVGDNIGESTDL